MKKNLIASYLFLSILWLSAPLKANTLRTRSKEVQHEIVIDYQGQQERIQRRDIVRVLFLRQVIVLYLRNGTIILMIFNH